MSAAPPTTAASLHVAVDYFSAGFYDEILEGRAMHLATSGEEGGQSTPRFAPHSHGIYSGIRESTFTSKRPAHSLKPQGCIFRLFVL